MRPLAFLLILLLTGCATGVPATLYAPSAPLAPLFTEAGQAAASGGVSAGAGIDAEGRLALSPLPHTFVFAGGTLHLNTEEQPGDLMRRRGEAGVGGYASLGRRFAVEALVGAAAARQRGLGTTGENLAWRCLFVPLPGCAGRGIREHRYRADVGETFAQATLAHRLGSSGALAASLRLTRARFTRLQTTPGPLPAPSAETFLEPSLLLRVPAGRLHLDLSGGLSYRLGSRVPWTPGGDLADPLFRSTGLVLGVRVGSRASLW